MRLTLSLAALLYVAPLVSAHPGHAEDDTLIAVNAARADDDGNQVTITIKGEYRYITANGLPDHTTGRFPNRGNPNRISEQDYTFRVPLRPEANDRPTRQRGPFGVALNGVPFDPGTAEYWSPNGRRFGPPRDGGPHWNYDALSGKINLGLDKNNAHVQPTGAYHYHGLPTGLLAKQLGGEKQTAMVLLGYAADGFPVYSTLAHEDPNDPDSPLKKMTASYRLKDGQRPGGDDGPGDRYDGTFVQDWEYVEDTGDLDECNGRTGVTPEHPDGTYYYVITDAFPFIPRMHRGTPDRSFRHTGGGRHGNDGDRRRPPPPGDRPPPRR